MRAGELDVGRAMLRRLRTRVVARAAEMWEERRGGGLTREQLRARVDVCAAVGAAGAPGDEAPAGAAMRHALFNESVFLQLVRVAQEGHDPEGALGGLGAEDAKHFSASLWRRLAQRYGLQFAAEPEGGGASPPGVGAEVAGSFLPAPPGWLLKAAVLPTAPPGAPPRAVRQLAAVQRQLAVGGLVLLVAAERLGSQVRGAGVWRGSRGDLDGVWRGSRCSWRCEWGVTYMPQVLAV